MTPRLNLVNSENHIADAPEGYQAPGFLSTEENQDHLEPTLPESVKLGFVETPFHKLTTRCYIRSNIGSSHEAIVSVEDSSFFFEVKLL